MSEAIKWILIIGFGVLFMGWYFFLYLISGFVIFFLLMAFFPNWFKGL